MASNNQTTILMPSPNADAATQWAYLEEGLYHMMNEPQNVPYAKYMALYTVCYNYCSSVEIRKKGRTNEVRGRSRSFLQCVDVLIPNAPRV